MNPVSPDQLTRAERLDEVARLLALAILRRRERAHRQSESSESGLDLPAKTRPDVPPEGGGT